MKPTSANPNCVFIQIHMTKFAGALQRCEEVLVTKVYPQLPDDSSGTRLGDQFTTIGLDGLPSREASSPAGGIMADKIRKHIEESHGKLRVIMLLCFTCLTKYFRGNFLCTLTYAMCVCFLGSDIYLNQ